MPSIRGSDLSFFDLLTIDSNPCYLKEYTENTAFTQSDRVFTITVIR